ncbi:hypothetical protein MMC26_002036 [Xylographa opegraphella]|nr:hypothetical protein [Xylographa opegraphella]
MSSLNSINSIPVNWALTGVAGVFTVARYAIRGYITRWSFTKWSLLDDIFHLLAFIVLIAHGVTNGIANDAKAQLKVLLSAEPKTSEAVLLAFYHHLYQLNSVNNCFLYSVFWLVKFSFLMFYRHLFDISTTFRKAWWFVLGLTVVTFWVPIGGVLATCAQASTIPEYTECNSADYARMQKLEYTCAIIVLSDLAIMALPLWMLKGLKMKMSQKLGLIFVFSFALFIVALDILRTVEAIWGNQILYTILEINFAVIISCLPTFRSLLNMNQARKSSRSGAGSSRHFSNWSRSKGSKKFSNISNLSNLSAPGERKFSKISDDVHPLRADLESAVSYPTNSIHYSKGFTVTNEQSEPDILELQNRVKVFSRP